MNCLQHKVNCLVTALQLRSNSAEAGGPLDQVATLARSIADVLHVKEPERTYVAVGALLHDIGKLGMPDAILQKPASLTAEEWAMMRSHTMRGKQLLIQNRFPLAVARVAAEHHEKFDGSGYPNGLHGKQISLAARIVTVADSVEAMSAKRCYKAADEVRDYEWIVDELHRCAGHHFDPDVVEAFLHVPRSKVSQ